MKKDEVRRGKGTKMTPVLLISMIGYCYFNKFT